MSGISNGCCLATCSTTTRTGLISDSRRTRQQAGLQRSALGPSARFNPFRDSVGCTIVMRWQLRLKSYFSEDQTLFLEPGRGRVHVFCEHLSPGDDSACNPRPTSLRQAETNPLWRAQRFGELQQSWNYSIKHWKYIGSTTLTNLRSNSTMAKHTRQSWKRSRGLFCSGGCQAGCFCAACTTSCTQASHCPCQ